MLASDALKWLLTVMWCLVLGAAAAVVVLASLEPHSRYFDAQVLLGASRAVLGGQTPYGDYFQSPLWTALLLVPFAVFPGEAGYMAWFLTGVACWIAATLALFHAMGWPCTRPARVAAASLLLLYPPVIWALHGQVTSFMALGAALFLLLQARHPFLAGLALALLLVKPHLAIFPIGVIVLASLLRKHWRVPLGIAAGTAVLVLVSVLVQPTWPGQWLQAVLNPPAQIVRDRALYAPTITAFTGLWAPGWLASALGWAAGILVGLGVLGWVSRERRAAPAVLLAPALPALFLVGPYSQGYDLSLLAFPLAILAPAALRQGRCWRSAVPLALLLGVYLFPILMVMTDWPQPVLVICPMLALAAAAMLRDHRACRSFSGESKAPDLSC